MAEGSLIRLICDEIKEALKDEMVEEVFARSKQAHYATALPERVSRKAASCYTLTRKRGSVWKRP